MVLPRGISSFPFCFAFMLLSYLLFGSSNVATSLLGTETDSQALLEFKDKITSDPLGILSSWNDTVHLCQWRGVTCGSRHRRVVALHLNASKLMGSISPHLGNLSFLRLLNLDDNRFGNEIPPEIWDLGKLEKLGLANNSIVGVIPSNLSCSSKLILLDLGGNLLSGEIPSMLDCFVHLKFLWLDRNKFIGRVPPSLGNLSSLEVLNLMSNYMTGAIPESLGQLKNLATFFLDDNGFSGSISSSIFNLSNMRLFGVTQNQFQGSLPAEIGTNMPYIEGIYIAINQFSGSIPPSISNATCLVHFSAGVNKFTGQLPSDLSKLNNLTRFDIPGNHIGSGEENDLIFICSLVNATGLEELTLGSNNLGGAIPDCVGNLSTNIRSFLLDKNKLTGKIPSAIGNLINLEWLSFYKNRLSGHIPSSIGSLHKLQELYLSINNLSGSIPTSFGNLKMLTRLTMDENNLEGSIPPSLGECKSLIALDISDNKLNGLIPAELFKFSSFSMGIRLRGNLLVGNIPSEVGNLKGLGELYVDHNLLSGELQNNLGNCESLERLDISGNSFRGVIPSSWSSLKALQILNLSNNNLTGEIPRFLESLKLLNVLDLSFNDFKGIVPSQGIFTNRSVVTVVGNNKLCGGILEFHLPKCNFHESNKIGKRFLIMITSLVLGAILVVSVILIYWLRRKGNISTSGKPKLPFLEISYHDLFKATNGFSITNLIGSGSFGSVYKGFLDENNRVFAVKVLNLLQNGASKSFLAECEVLRNVRHRNLVKILTVCSSINYQGNDFKALVYEFMSNGNLDEWLHQKSELVGMNQRPRILNLLQRLGISIDVACGLDYLHNQYTTPIVHCDLKPSNILLNDDMTAYLSDFGLARFLFSNIRDSLQNDTSSIGIRGSIGYMAPEYSMTSDVSTNGDVYSYGVLVLEMFTGKTPTNEMFQDGLNLHEFAKAALLTNIWEAIDPALLHENQIPRSRRMEEWLISIFKIGVVCSSEIPKERMNMGDVVAQLSFIKQNLLKTQV